MLRGAAQPARLGLNIYGNRNRDAGTTGSAINLDHQMASLLYQVVSSEEHKFSEALKRPVAAKEKDGQKQKNKQAGNKMQQQNKQDKVENPPDQLLDETFQFDPLWLLFLNDNPTATQKEKKRSKVRLRQLEGPKKRILVGHIS